MVLLPPRVNKPEHATVYNSATKMSLCEKDTINPYRSGFPLSGPALAGDTSTFIRTARPDAANQKRHGLHGQFLGHMVFAMRRGDARPA